MLSDDLRNLHDRLAAYERGGTRLSPGAVVGIRAVLKAAIDDARALETCTVPAGARRAAKDLPGNVVRIADVLLPGEQPGPRLANGPDGGPEHAA